MSVSQRGVEVVVDGPADRHAQRRHPLLSVWALTTVVVFALSALWSFATPINATNDEGSQVLKAVSVVRGQILGTSLTPALARTPLMGQSAELKTCITWVRMAHFDGGPSSCRAPFTIVHVPESFAAIPGNGVCNGNALFPDTCPTHLDGSNRTVAALTYNGRYPPLYYAVVGLPSLLSQTDAAIYAMRLVSGLLTAILIGLSVALVAVWSSRRLLLLAVTVAATPMLLVFGSTVNPSGLEMSAALCTWTGLLILVLEHAERPPTGLVAACTATAAVMALTRPLSPVWLVLIAAVTSALRPTNVRALASDRRVRTGFAVVVVATLVATVYVLWAHALNVLPVGSSVTSNGLLQAVETAFGHVPDWMYDFTGSFGWALANPPLAATALLTFALCAVVLTGFLSGERHQVVVLATLTVTALLLPIAIVVSQAHKDGIVWQARDGFPLYCGVILVAGVIARDPATALADPARAGRNRVVQRLAIIVAGCVAFAQFADLMWALRRYEDGLIGSVNVFGHFQGAFSPPLPPVLIVLVAAALCAAYGWWIVRVFAGMPSPLAVTALLEPSSKPDSTESEENGELAPENDPSPRELVAGGGP